MGTVATVLGIIATLAGLFTLILSWVRRWNSWKYSTSEYNVPRAVAAVKDVNENGPVPNGKTTVFLKHFKLFLSWAVYGKTARGIEK